MIRSKDENCVSYVGSTTKQYLSQRMDKHRSGYKQWKKNEKNFVSSFTLFEKYGIENCYIELLELCPCKSIEELLKSERFWFDKLNCVNIVKPFMSKEENAEYLKAYQQEHKEEIAEKRKIHYETNKEEIAGKTKIYQQTHKEEYAERSRIYQQTHKEEYAERRKIHYETNKEEIAEKSKIKYQKNKEEIAEKRKETYECPCGSVCRKDVKTRHNRSKKHQDYLSTVRTLCSATIT